MLSFSIKQQQRIVRLARAFSIVTPANVTVKKINENLEFRKREKLGEEAVAVKDEVMSKPLVLLFSWLQAKQKHIEKFGDYYLTKGWDVLTVKVTPSQLLLPRKGTHLVAEDVAQFVQHEDRQHQPLMVHAFSIGGYVYTEVLLKVLQQLETEMQRQEFHQRIIGQVYDSVADVGEIPVGLSRAVTERPVLQVCFQKCIEGYMRLMRKIAVQYYLKASHHFHHNPVNSPALFVYSNNDPVSPPEVNEKAARNIQDKLGCSSVVTKCFNGSSHVSHMYKYPNDYTDMLDKFTDQWFRSVTRKQQ